MTDAPEPAVGEQPPECSDPDCSGTADFRQYDAQDRSWRPVCTRHARTTHPSLEVKAWLESGYMRPVEVGQPTEPPPEPATGRAAAFRELVEETMGWTDGE